MAFTYILEYIANTSEKEELYPRMSFLTCVSELMGARPQACNHRGSYPNCTPTE